MTAVIIYATVNLYYCVVNTGSFSGCGINHYLTMGSSTLILLLICGIAFAGGGIIISGMLAKKSYNPQKGLPYECGIPTIGSSWIQFRVGYYLFALLFLVFDVEMVFMYPWAVVVKETGITAFFEILVFIFILFMGLLYAWKAGALKWS